MKAISWVVVLVVLAILVVVAMTQFNQSSANRQYAQAEREYARAYTIAQQGQARLDAGVATAGMATAMFPYVFIFGVLFMGILIIGFGIFWMGHIYMARSEQQQYNMALERVYLYQQLGYHNDARMELKSIGGRSQYAIPARIRSTRG